MNIQQAKQHLAVTAKRGFPLLCLGTVVVATVFGLLGSSFFVTPFAVAAVYVLALGVLHFEAQKDRLPS